MLLLRVSASLSSENEPQPKRRRLSDVTGSAVGTDEASRLYGAELVVYDRHSRCLLIDGDYELVMKEIIASETNGTSPNGSDKSPRKGNASWSTLDSANSEPLNILTCGPILKFRLEWANDPISALVDRFVPETVHSCCSFILWHYLFVFSNVRPKPYVASANTQPPEKTSSRTSSNCSLEKNPVNGAEEPTVVRYQFLYNSSRRQQTETRNDFRCPWCSLHCLQLPALLKHLRLCHSRFNFSHVVRISFYSVLSEKKAAVKFQD